MACGLVLLLFMATSVMGQAGQQPPDGGKECNVLYVLQPPPELPCNPFEENRYEDVVLLCSVALSVPSFQEPFIDITVKWFKKESQLSQRRVWPQMFETQMENFIRYETSLPLGAALRTENVSYWCQVTTTSDTSLTFQPSTVTTIRSPEHYSRLPRCVPDVPLGLPQAECAISGITLNPPPKSPPNCQCSSAEAQSGSESLVTTSACNGTGHHGGGSSNSAAVVAPVVILVLLLVIVAVALVSVLVGVIYKHKLMEKRRLRDYSSWSTQQNSVTTRSYTFKSSMQHSLAKKLRRVSSLPEIHEHEPITNKDSTDSGVIVDHIYANASNQFRAGVLLEKIRNVYESKTSLDHLDLDRKPSISDYTQANPSLIESPPRVPSRVTSDLYVVPDQIETPPPRRPRPASQFEPNRSSSGSNQVYLSLYRDSESPSTTPAHYEAPSPAHILSDPIYEAI